MTFDKQEHKDAVLALLNQATFPGQLLELALELKEAVTGASVMKVTPPLAANKGPKTSRKRSR